MPFFSLRRKKETKTVYVGISGAGNCGKTTMWKHLHLELLDNGSQLAWIRSHSKEDLLSGKIAGEMGDTTYSVNQMAFEYNNIAISVSTVPGQVFIVREDGKIVPHRSRFDHMLRELRLVDPMVFIVDVDPNRAEGRDPLITVDQQLKLLGVLLNQLRRGYAKKKIILSFNKFDKLVKALDDSISKGLRELKNISKEVWNIAVSYCEKFNFELEPLIFTTIADPSKVYKEELRPFYHNVFNLFHYALESNETQLKSLKVFKDDSWEKDFQPSEKNGVFRL